MSAAPAQPPEHGSPSSAREEAGSALLLDRVLPRYDLAVVHARVFRASPAVCYHAASELDLFQDPVVRALLDVRGLPQRLAGTVRGGGVATTGDASRATFRLRDMGGVGWILLGETPDVEIVLGQVSRPWKAVATSTDTPETVEQFVSFDRPGFAKIATSLRVDPYGTGSTILTMETRARTTPLLVRQRGAVHLNIGMAPTWA